MLQNNDMRSSIMSWSKDEFTINECDKCVYSKTATNACIIVCLYADDMLILGTNIGVFKFTKRILSNNFDMKDLGIADVILEIKITRILDWINLSQSYYMDKMIERFKKQEILTRLIKVKECKQIWRYSI